MHYATKELTGALQELTSKSEQQPGPKDTLVPRSIAAREFAVPKEVESFLEKMQDYFAKTRNVHIGTYY